MNVELIYDGECPNVGLARERLIEALKQTKSALKWTEWERTDRNAPSYVSQYASPTILIDRIDVCADTSVLDGKGGCRLYRSFEGSIEGAPSFHCLLTALRPKASHINLNGKSRASVYASLGTVIVAALPVGACPACLPAYAGILSSIGLGFAFDSVASLVLLSILLAISLFTLLWRSNRSNGYNGMSPPVSSEAPL